MTLTPAQAQEMREMLGDILAKASMIKHRSPDAIVAVAAEGIIEAVIKLSAEIPVEGRG